MTRINADLYPRMLTDQHLVAERTEINFAISSARRSYFSKLGLRTSTAYTLGAGHVTFFHDKLLYLWRRWEALSEEMRVRNMNPKQEFPWEKCEMLPSLMWNDYQASAADQALLKARIRERILKKPDWYRWFKAPVPEEIFKFYQISLDK